VSQLPRGGLLTPTIRYTTTRFALARDSRLKVSASNMEDQSAMEYEALEAYQKTVPRLSPAERARTLVQNSGFGILSTLARGSESGYPSGSVTEYVADENGCLLFYLSDLGAHKGDLRENAKCSFTVLQNGFQGMQDARINIMGSACEISDSKEAEAARELYISKHPNSFWIDFGDFSIFRLEDIVKVRMVGGFGMAGSISPDAYRSTMPDPVAAFSGPVCGHMNQDHAESTVAMVKHYAGISVDSAVMMALDKFGIDVKCVKDGETFNCRLGFPEPAMERKAIKDQIVVMSRSASAN
jgi:putative heme iron utilization protein